MDYNATYRQKNSSWQVIISYKDTNGKWKQKSKQGFSTKRKAKIHSDKIIEQLKEKLSLNTPDDFLDITFEGYAEKYMVYVENTFEYGTMRQYENTLSSFKALNHLKLTEINHIHIESCIYEMNKTLKPITQRCRLQYLKAMFNRAVNEYEIIQKNPAKNVRIRTSKNDDNKTILNSSELNDLLSKMRSMTFDYYIFVLLAAHCGLRKGETSGLIWSDINFKENTISISRQLKIGPNGKVIGELKSSNSYRTIPMSNLLNKELITFKKKSTLNINGRLFPHDVYYNQVHNYIKKTGYSLRYHDLRHSYATILLANDIDVKTVASLIGDTVETVLDTYIHYSDDMRLNAKNAISKIF